MPSSLPILTATISAQSDVVAVIDSLGTTVVIDLRTNSEDTLSAQGKQQRSYWTAKFDLFGHFPVVTGLGSFYTVYAKCDLTWNQVGRLEGGEPIFSLDGRHLIAPTRPSDRGYREVTIWRVTGNGLRVVRNLPSPKAIGNLAISPNGSYLVARGPGRGMTVWYFGDQIALDHALSESSHFKRKAGEIETDHGGHSNDSKTKNNTKYLKEAKN